ncbi:MAG TPA: carboxypeptidase-like regulatory domain-containing protein [Candidatus Limnocylindrales bacterium]|nr:carboxypeptidase-like regulatory domain-containing protein [Candidatus Limnocylindrales bacterium]
MIRSSAAALLLPAILLIAGACSSGAASPPPANPPASPPAVSPGPSASGGAGRATTPDEAAALVIAADPRFKGIARKNPDLIGGCCFYEATDTGGGSFAVTIEIGWGDCPAGCADRHHWFYIVTPDGVVTLQREDGPPVPAGVTGGGGDTGGGGGILPAGPGIAGLAVAGPTCPVVRPGDPNCNDRPVVGATILIRDASGTVVAELATGSDGRFQAVVPPGAYRVEPQPLEGLLGTASAIDVTVGAVFETVAVAYGTGIR